MNELLPQDRVRPVPDALPAAFNPQSFDGLQNDGDDVQLREYWRIVYKHRLLILAAALIGVIFSCLYIFTATPLYQAESTIRISTYEPILGSAKIEDTLQEKSRESAYLETQIQEIGSFSLADKVLSDPQIKQAFNGRAERQGILSKLMFWRETTEPDANAHVFEGLGNYQNSISKIKAYLDLIKVQPVRKTSLVSIETLIDNPTLAALVANKHALAYIDWVREKRMEQQSRGLRFLTTQADELREKVVDLEREVAEYAESNSIVALNKDENITVQKMSRLNQILTDATAKRIEAEHTYKEAENSLDKDAASFDDASIQSLRSQLGTLEAEQQQLSAKFTSSYPKMQQISAQIAKVRESIAAQRTQIVAGLKTKYLATVEEEKQFKEELEQQKSQTFELSRRQVQYNVLNRELTTSRDLLQNILKQIKETSLAVENNASNISVVDYAVVPLAPAWPRKRVTLMVGLLLGALSGVGLAFLLSYLDNTVRTPEDVQRTLRLPALGVVPSFELEGHLLPAGSSAAPKAPPGPDAKAPAPSASGAPEGQSGTLVPAKGDMPPIVFIDSPRSLASEAYRTIRTGILLSQAGEPPRTLLVTSSQSSEGKTTTSVNLAASLAGSGGRVVIIDADLRRPNVWRHFNLNEGRSGLVEVLTGLACIEEVLVTGLIENVHVITSGRIPPNPAELLGSDRMVRLLDRLAQEYDYVIVDSPPILPVTDSAILSRYVDGALLVVRASSTPRQVVRDAKDRLRAVGARILGVVLNDVDVRGGDYYYYNRYYHAYYREEDVSNSRRPPRRAV